MDAKFPVQLAKEAILLSKFAEAVDILRPIAKPDNPEAQFLYGYLYFLNPELTQTDALDMMRAAANHDHAEELYVLATCPTLESEYVFAAPTTSNGWKHLRRAVRLGSPAAKVKLAQLYMERQGSKSRRYWKKAHLMLSQVINRRRGRRRRRSRDRNPYYNLEAYYRLGLFYLNHPVGKRTFNQAAFYLSLAVDLRSDQEANPYIRLAQDKLNELAQHDSRALPDHVTSVMQWYLANENDEDKPIWTDWQNYLHGYCSQTLHYDMTNCTFEEFVAFQFEHFVTEHGEKWYDKAKVTFEPRRFFAYYLQLLHEPAFLLERFDSETLDQGFSRIRYDYENWSRASDLISRSRWTKLKNPSVQRILCLRSCLPLLPSILAASCGGSRHTTFCRGINRETSGVGIIMLTNGDWPRHHSRPRCKRFSWIVSNVRMLLCMASGMAGIPTRKR